MKRYEAESIGDVLRTLLEETSLQNRMQELKAAELWARIVGPQISSLTRYPEVKNGVMSIGVPNAALRHELYMNRTKFREMMNEYIGNDIISEIKFTS